MARTPRDASLENRTNRLGKLTVRRLPYYGPVVAPGVTLGYRRCAGPGRWVVRCADGKGGSWQKAVAVADDYEDSNGDTVLDYFQAVDKARTVARGGASSDRPLTVAEAVDRYEDALRGRGGSTRNASRVRHHLPASLASKTVSLLGARELHTWRDGLVKQGLTPATADRNARVLKAALALAASENPTASTNAHAWKALKRLPDREVENRLLTDSEVQAVVAAAYRVSADYGLLIQVAAESGQRASQILRLKVQHLQDGPAPRLVVPPSRKGKAGKTRPARKVPISRGLATALRHAAHGRGLNAPLLVQADGTPWEMIDLVLWRKATAMVGLDAAITPYNLRHSSIVRQLKAAVPTAIVASVHDTSVHEIERCYGAHITDVSDALVRAALLDVNAPAG